MLEKVEPLAVNRSLSVLSKVNATSLRLKPFPHLVIEDALNLDVANQLRSDFPKPEQIGVDQGLSNNRWDLSAHEIIGSEYISDLWKQVIAYHTSNAFWSEIYGIFGKYLAKAESQLGTSLAAPRVGVRGSDSFESKQLLLDAQISGNTPVRETSSVRGTHIDKGDKIFSALLYLRDNDDESTGGDFVIQRWRSGIPKKLRLSAYHEGMKAFRESVTVVPYRHNTLVFLLNSPDSLHAVTARSQTASTRKFMNLVGVVPKNLYHVPDDNLISRFSRKYRIFGTSQRLRNNLYGDC